MKRILTVLLMALLTLCSVQAQRMQDNSYRTIGYVKQDGTVQDGSYRTIGHIKRDGTVQDASYRTVGHAEGVSTTHAAVLFFFGLLK